MKKVKTIYLQNTSYDGCDYDLKTVRAPNDTLYSLTSVGPGWTPKGRKLCVGMHDHGNGVTVTIDGLPEQITLDYGQIAELYLVLAEYAAQPLHINTYNRLRKLRSTR